MSLLPEDAQKIEVMGATVDFYKYMLDGVSTYHFDTSKCGPPDPMVNGMAGLQLLDDKSQLIMINHKAPGGLFPKVEAEFHYDVKEIENGFVQVTFTKKTGVQNSTDFGSVSCSG